MKFTRNSVAVVVAVVASLSAGTAAVAMNLGAADSSVPSPAGRLITETSAVAPPPTPSTIYIDQPVEVPVPANPSAPVSSGSVTSDSTGRSSSGSSSGGSVAARPGSSDDNYDSNDDDTSSSGSSSEYEGHDDDD